MLLTTRWATLSSLRMPLRPRISLNSTALSTYVAHGVCSTLTRPPPPFGSPTLTTSSETTALPALTDTVTGTIFRSPLLAHPSMPTSALRTSSLASSVTTLPTRMDATVYVSSTTTCQEPSLASLWVLMIQPTQTTHTLIILLSPPSTTTWSLTRTVEMVPSSRKLELSNGSASRRLTMVKSVWSSQLSKRPLMASL